MSKRIKLGGRSGIPFVLHPLKFKFLTVDGIVKFCPKPGLDCTCNSMSPSGKAGNANNWQFASTKYFNDGGKIKSKILYPKLLPFKTNVSIVGGKLGKSDK